ncbi:MAG: hypothetical protein J6U54_15290 [Clostridiales bacterium]|nr:hypothetical protein [Clostridiales bacterium]
MAKITIENYRIIHPSIGDDVIFALNGKEIRYQVTSSHLTCCGLSNDVIFDTLGIRDKRSYCRDIYGYSPVGDGIFPQCENNDFDALKRIINALFRKIEESTPEQTITIDNYKSIPYIKLGDKIKFDVNGETINYKVCGCFLEESSFRNALIFSKLSLDKMVFCTNAYGYNAAGGSFPECKSYDLTALHRAINGLFDHMRSIAAHLSTGVEPKVKSNSTEFKVESVKAPSLTTTFKIIL